MEKQEQPPLLGAAPVSIEGGNDTVLGKKISNSQNKISSRGKGM
jgi:hypothetical protein